MEKTIKIKIITADFEKDVVLTEEMLNITRFPEYPIIEAIKEVWEKQYGIKLHIYQR